MSELVGSKLPCPCGQSSDAYHTYSDGHGFCFSCKKDFQGEKKEEQLDGESYQYVATRGITQATMEYYGVLTKVNADGEPVSIAFPYNNDEALKVRDLDRKDFRSEGNMKDATLFGKEKFSHGQAMAITITEGEFDALAAFQMLGSKYPVVSVRSSSTARKDCERERDYLNSFEKIYLCFDNDPVGQKALREVALLFDPNKVFHVKLKHKDANDYLQAGDGKEFVNVWYNARPYMPKDIIATWSEVEEILNREESPIIGEYPFARLNEMAYGIRSGEFILFKAPEKVGKTEVFRAIEYHILKSTDLNIGIIHLEEQEKRSVQGLVGYELRVPCHLPDSGVSSSDVAASYRLLTKRDSRCHFYSHFGSDDPDTILDVIRYLVTVRHCKLIFLDHITMLVTGFEGEDERKKLDYLSTRLAMLTRELDFTLMVISHVNDDGRTRGSRNIAKVADLIISLSRDLEAALLDERNKTYVTVQGNRFAGLTGPSGVLWFDPQTFTLKEMAVEDAPDPHINEFAERMPPT